MGIPWCIATTYHKIKYDSNYAVPPGSLSFSVMVFLACSMVNFAVLIGRRCYFGGELGGPKAPRYITAAICILLWFVYVILLSLDAYDMLGRE